MLTFRHKASGYVIGINYKVMFSFVTGRPALFEPAGRDWCDFLFWRDPLDRVVSLFFDKCRQAVNPAHVQHVQTVLLVALGLTQVTELSGVSFDEVVRILGSVIALDGHLRWQLDRVDLNKVGEVVDISTDLGRVGEQIGADFSPRDNFTSHGPALEYYTPETRSIVEDLYAQDYLARGHVSAEFKSKRLMGLIK